MGGVESRVACRRKVCVSCLVREADRGRRADKREVLCIILWCGERNALLRGTNELTKPEWGLGWVDVGLLAGTF